MMSLLRLYSVCSLIIVLNEAHHRHVFCILNDMIGGMGGNAVMGKQAWEGV